jgi:hypothetical protein
LTMVFRSSRKIYEYNYVVIIKETHSRCTKIAEKKYSSLIYAHR